MAMNGTTMGDAVVTAIQGVNPKITQKDIVIMKPFWEAICAAIVAHIQTNGSISVTTSPGTMNVGGTAVTGSGSGSGTIT